MISCNNGKVYFIGINSTKLECLDLQTKQKETLYELPKTGASIQGIYDNKLQYVYYSGNTGKVDSAYYIDLATKENKNFKLVDDNDYLVEISICFIVDVDRQRMQWSTQSKNGGIQCSATHL